MKVLNIAWDDYANFSYDNCQALKSVGIHATSVKRIKHPFGYPNTSPVITDKHAIYQMIDSADVIQLMHSYPEFLAYCVAKKKRIFVYHTGTNYRMNAKGMNQIFNPYVERSFTDQCEFMQLGAKDLAYIATAINPDEFRRAVRPLSNTFTIGHYPSNPEVKGTAKIAEMLHKVTLPFEYKTSNERVDYHRQMKRMQDCDIYIELFKPEQNGRPYGCYGVTAFEAAAMGKIVVTNNIHPEVYKEFYGRTMFYIANTEEDFISAVEFLLSQSPEQLKRIQTVTRQWLIDNHSYKATGTYLSKYIL